MMHPTQMTWSRPEDPEKPNLWLKNPLKHKSWTLFVNKDRLLFQSVLTERRVVTDLLSVLYRVSRSFSGEKKL